MKYITSLVCLFILISVQAFSQKIEGYYDYNWKPCDPLVARFYSIAQKTDSGWFRHDFFIGNKQMQMETLYEDSACNIQNGRGIFFYPNGQVSILGRAVHNKREGICLSFYSNGIIADSANYHNGVVTGYELKWHRNGYLSDSIAKVNDSMTVHISWFDNGQPASAGYLLHGKLYGKWQYFHKNGTIAALEIYRDDILLSKKYYDETGTLLTDTASKDRGANFKGGMEGWKNYLEKSLYWPANYKFETGNKAVTVIDLTVNEEGKIEDAEVVVPFHPAFDDIALRTIRLAPKWQPAIEHNRFIKYHFRQSVTFQEPE